MILDPAITLFGKTIQLNDSAAHHTQTQQFTGIHLIKEVAEDELLMENDKVDNPSEDGMDDMDDESTDTTALQQQQQQQQTTTTTKKKKKDAKAGGKDEKEWDDETKKEELKKPDKILPCPRCKSMDTKFCYYNNYNVNQPRHFCKACQRYWTAGGTMRNVPVGAGRRKNKTSAAAARPCPSHFTLPDESTHHGTTVLTFGSENRDDRSSTASTLTTASASVSVSMEDQSIKDPGFAIANPMQCYQGPYMWHPAVPFCPPVFPVPVFHHPYWNGSPVPWNVPLVPHPNSPQPTTLGKHTRDGEIIAAPTSTSNVLTPKTLRIDDPDEAAKSSIWTTLGIRKDNKGDCVSKGFFNSIQTKDESEKKECEAAAAAACYKANPVALCRSANFQEAA